MKAWKTVKILGITIVSLSLVILLLLALGDFFLNRYLNNDGREVINESLPFNGSLSYDKVSIHPFRDFPNISLKISKLHVRDSLALETKKTPLMVEALYFNASLKNFRKKKLKIKSVDLNGLTLNVLDREDGYSNIASLIQSKVKDSTSVNLLEGWTVDFDYSDLKIRDLQVHKTNEITGQMAHLYMDELSIKNTTSDSAYQLNIAIEDFIASPVSDKSWAQIPLQVKKARAEVLLNKSFSIAKLVNVELSDGNIDLEKDLSGLTNFSDLIGAKEGIPKNDEERSNPTTFDADGADINLNDIDFTLVNQISKRNLKGRIIDLSTKINLSPDTSAIIDLHLDVDHLATNTDKGAFLINSIVKGQIQTNYSKNSLKLSSPTLSINEDTFDIQSYLSVDNRTPSTLTIIKEDADAVKIKPLLTDDLQKKASPYDVKGPIYAKAHIVFTPGVRKARADLHMKVDNQTLIVKGTVVSNANVSATLINGLYDDHLQYSENKKNVRFILHKASGNVNDFHVESENALITYTPEDGAQLIAKSKVTGEAASASKFLEHDRFRFKEGAFTMRTDINGSLDDLEDLIAGTDIDLEMKNLTVVYPAGNTSLPLNVLEMHKEGERTIFAIEGLAVGAGSPIHIQGEIEHLSSVLFPENGEQLETQAKIRANTIRWGGLVALFGQDGLVTAATKNREKIATRSMQQTLTGIQESFRPKVEITIDTVHYSEEVQLLDFKTGLNFKEDRTLVLEKTSFDIDKSKVTLDGEVVINQLDFTKFDFDIQLQHLDFDVLLPKFDYFGVYLIEQIHDQPDDLSMHIKLSGELDDDKGLRPETFEADITYESFAENKFSGSLAVKANPSTKKMDVVFGHSGYPVNINKLLGSKDYIFDKGWFTISFEFEDNFESIAQMVEQSKIGLTIADSEVLITELGVTIPLSRIEIASINNNAYYHMLIRSDSLDQELALDGVVKNMRHFAFNDTEKPYEIDLTVSSPRIVWSHLKNNVVFDDTDSRQSGTVVKQSLTKILRDFNPNVKLIIDTFDYYDLISFDNIFAHAYMEDDILKIDSANVGYGESHIEANLDIDMTHEEILPFDLDLALSTIDISHTLKHFKYFNQEELRSAKKIDGKVWLNLDMSAEIDLENDIYDYSKTDANLHFRVEDLVVSDLQTINTFTKRIGRKDRFDELIFAPIESHVKVRGTSIEIDRTEIQSNAMHAYVEGTIDRKSSENLWISVPLENLKKPDLDVIPDKTGYAESGLKIFFFWITSESKNDGKVKMRFSKRKFFQERLRGKEFLAHRRAMRKERRRLRREGK